MSTPLLVDIFEPDEMLPLLNQSITAFKESMNSKGYADYWWRAIDEHSIQYERKQAGELLSSLDEVEEQLRRQYDSADENGLIIQGIVHPAPNNRCAVYFPTKGDKFFVRDGYYNISYTGFMAWLNQLDKAGITIVNVTSLESVASTLVALYNNSLKEEHMTLRRYIKDKIRIHPYNPHILTLMGVAGGGLGEVRARALIEEFETAWTVMNLEVDELCEVEGIGKSVAIKFLKALGREV